MTPAPPSLLPRHDRDATWEASITLPPHRTSPRAARRLLELAAEQWAVPVRDATELLLTEVVTNAVVHAGTDMVVRFRVREEHLRVEVSDCSSRPPQLRHPNSRSENGRGLLLLQRLSSDWGWEEEDTEESVCKTVWFEVNCTPGDPDCTAAIAAFDIDAVEPL